ncbi:MAG: SDR family oxidoreductase [Sandaracinus sp.]|nr:SDR family oxidoreductase [Myxococcales bacterium]MCB9625408.1 SDR family oxidoreductase [Sandaracinus sp.]MCB9631345.1 SDR family oxidoreductase [Sandaracinus sp.]
MSDSTLAPNSPKTVLVTGCSSGYGLATARHFLARGHRVVATMRRPDPSLFADVASDRLRVVALDVTRDESIAAALAASGPIDVLVNNAGIGAFGPFEGVPKSVVREVFETNTFGVMALTQAVLPQMRARRAGVIVNVTSSATLTPMPLVAVYTASKMAIEGFTASLAFELASVGVQVKLVEPGYCATTAFTQNSGARIERGAPEAYAPITAQVMEAFTTPTETTQPHDVAEAVYRAAHDASTRLRFPAGPDAVALANAAA